MANWWELSENSLAADEEAQEARKADFFNTFYGTDSGKNVLLALCSECYKEDSTPGACLARIRLYNWIRAVAGVDVQAERAAIDAESKAIT